jgi:hypothetical protein
MTQEDKVLLLLRSGPKTTNEIIQSPYALAAEYRRAISQLRKRGFVITYHKRKGGTGLYTLDAEPHKVEANGQMAFA